MRIHPDHEHNVRCFIEAFFSSVEDAASMLERQPELLHASTRPRQETALHWLAVENHLEGVKFLLSRGASTDARASSGDTALTSAAALGYKEMCRILIDAGADVNAVDENEDSVLHHAAQSGKGEVIRLLVAAGADSSVQNTLGETLGDLAPPRLREQVLAALGSRGHGAV